LGYQTEMFKKIAFIHYPTMDLDRALKFYRDVLGLKLRVQNEEWVEFAVGEQRLALRKVHALPQRSDTAQPAGAMVWLEARPIEETIARLKAENVIITNDLEVFYYGKTSSFLDPDRNVLGLYEPPPEK